jgi:hypothetical protein
LADGIKSTEIEPNFARGHHRVANALEHLKRYGINSYLLIAKRIFKINR